MSCSLLPASCFASAKHSKIRKRVKPCRSKSLAAKDLPSSSKAATISPTSTRARPEARTWAKANSMIRCTARVCGKTCSSLRFTGSMASKWLLKKCSSDALSSSVFKLQACKKSLPCASCVIPYSTCSAVKYSW